MEVSVEALVPSSRYKDVSEEKASGATDVFHERNPSEERLPTASVDCQVRPHSLTGARFILFRPRPRPSPNPEHFHGRPI